MPQLNFYPIVDSYLVVLLAAVVLFGLMAFGPPASKTMGRRRTVLAALRVAVIVLLLLCMLRPTLVYTESKKQAATLIVLLDDSRSMGVPDSMGGKTRWEALRTALGRAAGELDKLAADFEIKAYAFDADPHELEVSRGHVRLPEMPEGPETAIGASLEDVLRLQAGKRLLGVILLSDGAQRAYTRDTAPQVAASRLKNLGYHLYTVPFGEARQGKDVAVQEMVCNEQVFVKNQMEITGQIRVDGFANREIPVLLKIEGAQRASQEVGRITVQAVGDSQLVSYRFEYVPEVPGEYKFTVEVPQQPGERVITNNQMSTFVDVVKGGVNVFYCEGTYRVEQKFLLRALRSSHDIQCDAPDHPLTHPVDLGDRFKPGKYDVYILGDVDSAALSNQQLTELAQAVRHGAGLLMLGGYESFGAGGYGGDNPLAGAIPVEMSPLERQKSNEPVRSDLHVRGPLKMRPVDTRNPPFALRLGDTAAASAAAWDRLPALEGANRFSGIKPGARTLAADGNVPLLVEETYGAGRSMAFAGDTTWRWWMHGHQNLYKRFWRQMILWLAHKDQPTEGNVWIKFQQRRLAPNQRAEFSVGAQSASGETLSDLNGEAEILMPDGIRRPVALVRQENLLVGSFRDTQLPGDYTLEATVRQKEQNLGKAHARFLVSQQDLELDNASADVALMTNLATMTGGEQVPPERLGELIHRLRTHVEHLIVQQQTKKTLWDTWPFLLLFVIALSVQWWLRKRWGLV